MMTVTTTMLMITTIMLEYDFMQNAFAAAGVAAVVSGLVGYFLVLRGQTFAGHALGHIGFAGATGAVLIGVASVWGLVVFTVAAGIAMGLMGDRISGRDVAIGVVLALALGFGLLFLHYYTAFAAQATALLFGNVLAVDGSMIATLIGLGISRWPRSPRSCGPSFSPACSRNSRKPKAYLCALFRPPFWPSSRSRFPKAPRSSAYFWFSALWSARQRRHNCW